VRALAVHDLHFRVLLHWKCKFAAPLAISDNSDSYREGRHNWFVTEETSKKELPWTSYAAPLVVGPDPVRASSLGSILVKHISYGRSACGGDDRSSRVMLGFRDQLPMDRLIADLEIPSELGQGRHRSRSALAYWHASSLEGVPIAGAVFRQVVDNWRSWGFLVSSDVEHELRAIGAWSEEPTPLFLHEMIPFRKVSCTKGEVTSDQELIGPAHGVIRHKLQTATAPMGDAIRRGPRLAAAGD
jgi:hypothetical protein